MVANDAGAPDVMLLNAQLITMDPERHVYRDGALAIRNGEIVAVGTSADLSARYPQAGRTIDASDKLVLPGCINAHTHIAMALFRGLYAGDPGSIYSIMFPIEESLEAEDVHYLGLLGAIECLKGGATTIADHYYFMEQIAQAVELVGLRAVLGHTVADRLAPFTGDNEKQRAIDFLSAWRERSSRITPALAPHSPETVSTATLSELKQISDREGVLIHIHLAQSRQEVEYLRSAHGMTPVEYLDHCGALGGNLLAAHAVFVDDADIDRLGANGVAVAFCPSSQVSYLYRDVTPVPELLSSGVEVVLGTDTAAGTGNMNILGEPRIASAVQLMRAGPRGRLSPQKLLEMITIGAAHAIGMQDKIGSLEVGKRADLLLIDLQNAELAPVNDPYATAIFSVTEPSLDTIMIDGEVVFSGGVVAGVDERRIVEKARTVRTAVLDRALDRHPQLSGSIAWPGVS